MNRFVAWLHGWIKAHDPVQAEIARHEMSATVHRYMTTRADCGVSSMNTLQLAWCVVGSGCSPGFIDHPFFTGLLTSALLDGDPSVFEQAVACEVVPASMAWAAWARDFSGDEMAFIQRLGTLRQLRELAGAVTLATTACPELVGPRILEMLCKPALALVFLRVLEIGLGGPRASEVAQSALELLAKEPEVLFAGRVDRILAMIVPHVPNPRLDELFRPLLPAIGEGTTVAVAENHLRAGRAADALPLVKDTRFLSPWLAKAALIACLASLELGQFEQARHFASHIEDELTRTRIGVRLAQATGDALAESTLLITLHDRDPADADTFVQLLQVLGRLGRQESIRKLCEARRELFARDPMVQRMMAIHLGKA
jgi:hypothetical protein